MPKRKDDPIPTLVAEWTLPAAATLGSSVRARGIMLEVRSRLPVASRKALDVVGSVLFLRMREGEEAAFERGSKAVSTALDGIEALPVIPREIEDILGITTTQRHRWLKDGRLPSEGTRTVKLRGRAKKITFHVFHPRKVEEILNDDLVSVWREDDAITAAENRKRAVWKAKLARAQKAENKAGKSEDNPDRPKLAGWEDFERDGLLR